MPTINLGDFVSKKSGSKWRGRVVGFYETALNKVGCAVESWFEPGSVQIYPEAALEPWEPPRGETGDDADRMRALLRSARPIIQAYATANPKHVWQGHEQDPMGAHAWLAAERAGVNSAKELSTLMSIADKPDYPRRPDSPSFGQDPRDKTIAWLRAELTAALGRCRFDMGMDNEQGPVGCQLANGCEIDDVFGLREGSSCHCRAAAAIRDDSAAILPCPPCDPLAVPIAAEITRLTALVAAHKENSRGVVEACEAELGRLREALEPFAKAEGFIKSSDVQRARDALAKKSNNQSEGAHHD